MKKKHIFYQFDILGFLCEELKQWRLEQLIPPSLGRIKENSFWKKDKIKEIKCK